MFVSEVNAGAETSQFSAAVGVLSRQGNLDGARIQGGSKSRLGADMRRRLAEARWKLAGCAACVVALLAAAIVIPIGTHAQESLPTTKLRVEVTGGDKSLPVDEASVYLKFVVKDKRKDFRDAKFELNLKTNKEGVATAPQVPRGSITIQIVAPGWKPFGQIYDIEDQEQTVKIHLDKPPRWY
jgi:hypothetical protein